MCKGNPFLKCVASILGRPKKTFLIFPLSGAPVMQFCFVFCFGIFERVSGWANYGQVECPWKDLAKCSSDAVLRIIIRILCHLVQRRLVVCIWNLLFKSQVVKLHTIKLIKKYLWHERHLLGLYLIASGVCSGKFQWTKMNEYELRWIIKNKSVPKEENTERQYTRISVN